jgi:two-component system cell cycle response regulator CtrA
MSSSASCEKKLADASMGKDCIETVWGRGYMLREPDEVRISKACPRATDRDAA